MAETEVPQADSQIEDDIAAEADLLQQALAELEAAIQPFEQSARMYLDISAYYYFLHLLWAEFHIYIVEPFAGGEGSGSGTGTAKVIPLDNGRKIFDYGFALSTSVGDDYGSLCQGRLYETIQEMIAILAKRGVKKVSFIGNSIAMRVGWLECVESQIEVSNYEPTAYDFSVRQRIQALKEKAKKLKPGQELRL